MTTKTTRKGPKRVEAHEGPPLCPRCKTNRVLPYGNVGTALSRRDNQTEICSDCGTKEGLEDAEVTAPYRGPPYWREVVPTPCPSPWHNGYARKDHPWKCPLCGISAMCIGATLPNGATVLEYDSKVILAKTYKNGEYVTWKWDGKNMNSTVYGHYFLTLATAAKNWEERRK